MKALLNISIPSDHISITEMDNFRRVLMTIRNKFQDKYDIIVTPERFSISSNNKVVNFTITRDTDLAKLLNELEELATPDPEPETIVNMEFQIITDAINRNGRIYMSIPEHYEEYHSRYMPFSAFLARSYDGDPDVDPSTVLDEYWYPIIEMVNFTDMTCIELLKILKNKNVNPFSIHSIGNAKNLKTNVDIIDIKFHNEPFQFSKNSEDDYIRWMIDQVTFGGSISDKDFQDLLRKYKSHIWNITRVYFDQGNMKVVFAHNKDYESIGVVREMSRRTFSAFVRRTTGYLEKMTLENLNRMMNSKQFTTTLTMPLDEVINPYNILYPSEIIGKAINNKRFQILCKHNMLTGQILSGNHLTKHPLETNPIDLSSQLSLDPMKAAFTINNVEIETQEEKKFLKMDIKTLNSPEGNILCLLLEKVPDQLFIAPRMLCNLERREEDRVIVPGDNFHLISFDICLRKENLEE